MGSAAELAGHTILIALYLTLNTALNLTNRYLLGLANFRFPFLLTLSHLGFAFVVLGLILHRRPPPAATTAGGSPRTIVSSSWRALTVAGACMAANVGCNNISLVSIPLALNQTLRRAPVAHRGCGALSDQRVAGNLAGLNARCSLGADGAGQQCRQLSGGRA